MPTDKKRIQAYVTEETTKKFRIITAMHGKRSMSEYASELIIDKIREYETEHGEIRLPEQEEK